MHRNGLPVKETGLTQTNMRKIDTIIIHCSATKEGQHFTVADIDKWHKARGFNGVGYHYVILLDGTIEPGRQEHLAGAHTQGHNATSIGICYVGGLDAAGNAKDTRTDAQKRALFAMVHDICTRHKIKEIKGHRDCSPDKNGNGIIEPGEWLKQCPCFDVRKEIKAPAL